MKKRIKSILLALAVLIGSIPVTMSAVADDTLPTYNAYNDFVNSSNPNGVWTYQYRTDKSVDTTDEFSIREEIFTQNQVN